MNTNCNFVITEDKIQTSDTQLNNEILYSDEHKYKLYLDQTLKIIRNGNYYAICGLNPDFYRDREFVLEAIKSNAKNFSLSLVDNELRKDKEVILEAVKKDAFNLQYASRELCGDLEIVLEAVSKDPETLKFASKELRNDKELVLWIYKFKGVDIWQYVGEKLRDDEEVVLEAIKQQNNEISKDRDLKLDIKYYNTLNDDTHKQNIKLQILDIISQKYKSIMQYVGPKLCSNKSLVMEAIKISGDAFKYATKEVVLEIIKEKPHMFKYANIELRNDRQFILDAVKLNAEIFQYASDELRKDREFIKKVERIAEKRKNL